MNQELLDRAFQFGKTMILSGDLDPVYVMLVDAIEEERITEVELKRWCLAYWYFYDVGVASYIASTNTQQGFWRRFEKCIPGKRGTERRHFRGKAATGTLDTLRGVRPEDYVDDFFAHGLDFQSIRNTVEQYPLCGPWIAFKIADMGEQVLGYPVDFSTCNLNIYTDPKKGAALLMHGDKNAKVTQDELDTVLRVLQDKFAPYVTMGRVSRGIGLPEVETVLCKFKSHYNGHYPEGKDTIEVYESIHHPVLDSPLAKILAVGAICPPM